MEELKHYILKFMLGFLIKEIKNLIKDLKNNNYENIDLVIVNFYPFEETLKKTTNHNKIIENIDIGGPAMVRAAAKNYNDVTVITSSFQYAELINELKNLKDQHLKNLEENVSNSFFRNSLL